MQTETTKTILLVDDEALIALAEAKQLQKYGFQVITASRGEEAVEWVEKSAEIDLILMDINLGQGMDGTQAAQIILQKRDLPLIFLSAHAEREVVEKTEGITSYGYVVKSSGETVLIASIKMAFKLFEAQRQEKAKEAALVESETSLRESQRVAHVGHWSWDTQTNRVQWSDEMKRMWGLDPETFEGDLAQVIAQAIHPEDRAKVEASNQAVLTEQRPAPMEYRILRPDGSVRTIWAVPGSRVTNQEGQILKLTGIVQDITERKETEQKIIQLTRLYAMLSQINQAIVRTKNAEALYRSICQVAIEFGQFSLAWVGLLEAESGQVKVVAQAGGNQEYLDHLNINLNHPQTRLGPSGSALQTGKIVFSEDILQDQNMQAWRGVATQAGYRSSAAIPFRLMGKVIGVFNLYSLEPFFFSNPIEQSLLQEIGLDLSYALEVFKAEARRNRAVEELRAREEQYYTILSALADIVVVLDEEGLIRYINQVAPGLNLGEVLGSNWLTWLAEEDKPVAKEAIRTTLETGALNEVTYRAVGANRQMTWFQVRLAKVIYQGQPNHVVLIARDITQAHQAEAALRASEERYRHISSSISDLAYSCVTLPNGEYAIDWLSGAVEQITGYTQEELLALRCWGKLVLDEDFPLFEKAVLGLAPGQKDECELRLRRKEGSVRWVIAGAECAASATSPTSTRLYGAIRDITDRKLVEAAYRESESRYRLIAENTADVIWIMDTATQKFKYISPSVFELRGYTPEEVLAQPVGEALTPTSAQRVAALLAERIPQFLVDPGQVISFKDEVDQPHKNGSVVHTEVTTTYLLNGRGNLEIIGISRDVTARKLAALALEKAFNEKSELFKELQHRVKNSFALILSLLTLMEDPGHSAETENVLVEIRSRIQAIGALYELLYAQDQISQIRVDEYLGKIVHTFSFFGRVHFTSECEALTLPAEVAASLGLILNELLTNALKHGFPGAKTGAVSVSLQKTAAGASLQVANDGLELPEGFDLATTHSMGMLVVTKMTASLRGQVRYERGAGTRWIIDFPLD